MVLRGVDSWEPKLMRARVADGVAWAASTDHGLVCRIECTAEAAAKFSPWLRLELRNLLAGSEEELSQPWSYVALGGVVDDDGAWRELRTEVGNAPRCPVYWQEVPLAHLVNALMDITR